MKNEKMQSSNFLILFMLCGLLSNCASKPVGENQTKSDGSIIEDQSDVNLDGTDDNQAEETTKEKPKTAKDVVAQNTTTTGAEGELERGLVEAIKSQNDNQIQQLAQQLVMQDSKNLRGLNSLALLHYKNGRFIAAQFLLNRAIKSYPKESDLYNNLGLVQLGLGERREALLTFKKGLQVNPQSAIIGANLGAIYVKERDFTKAELALEIPIKKGLKDAKVQNNYAITLAARGKKKDAADLFERLMKDNPSSKEIMFNNIVAKLDYLEDPKGALDLINRLKFVGVPEESRIEIKELENRAKAALK